jgi:hypothetical protein
MLCESGAAENKVLDRFLSGFRANPDLVPIQAALDDKKYSQAIALATELLERNPSSFASPKEQVVTTARALLLRADARNWLEQPQQDVLADEKQAALLGSAKEHIVMRPAQLFFSGKRS